jgi:ectoine hydroxylase-related dioxygenase (phytanoyl-CoA dioxygenase family)
MANLYGVSTQRHLETDEDLYFEEIEIKGYTVVKQVLTEDELAVFREKLDLLNDIQKKESGEDLLIKLKENNTVRLPLSYDDRFMDLIHKKPILSIVNKLVGDFVILHLQNGIINMSSQVHHQSSWHRDLPYQDFVISKPISISVLYCIDDFNEMTGGTFALPFSHKVDHLPSTEYIAANEVQMNAKAGDAIVFDSMLYHRAGSNTCGKTRRGINNIYTVPIIKQQINIPAALGGKFADDPEVAVILGYTSEIPMSVSDFRKMREKKLSKG